MSSTQRAFGQLVKDLRLNLGLTQEQLAKKAHLSGRVISDIERQIIATPQRATQEKLADALGVRGPERKVFFDSAPPRRRTPRRTSSLAPPPLPVPLTPLINRDGEVSEVCAFLRRADVRLVSLLGPVGVGKTRLSLEVGTRLHRTFTDGIWFVDLSSVDDPARIGGTIAGILGVRLVANKTSIEALAEQIREKRALLILDNLEQVDAGESLVALLQMTTRLKILATSRKALRVRVEQEFHVETLKVPDLADLPPHDQLARVESVALFVQCVQADLPHFQLNAANAHSVAAICAALDGLPLAIELAASRVKLMSPEQMVPRLQSRLELLSHGDVDLPRRHQSLRAAIAWSCDLLPEEARVVLRRFAVFADGATLPAVEMVCAGGEAGRRGGEKAGKTEGTGDRGQGTDVHSLSASSSSRLSASMVWSALGTLIDASLVRREELADGEVRFSVLQTIREWALESLEASGEEQTVRAAHALWAIRLAEEAEPHLFTADETIWLLRLRREQANLFAATEWAIAHDPGLALRLVGSLADVWYLRGQVEEGVECLRRALEAAPSDHPARTKALVGASILALPHGDTNAATQWATEARALAEATNDRSSLAKSLAALAAVVQYERNYRRALGLHQEALAIFTELGDQPWITNELCNLAWTARGMQDNDTAAAYVARLQEITNTTRDTFDANVTKLIHGDLALAAGNLQEAATSYHDVFAGSWRRGDRWVAADALVGFAGVMNVAGDPQHAARLLGAAEGLYLRLGVPFPRDRPDYPSWLASIRAQLDEGVFAQAKSAGAALTPNEIADTALRIPALVGA
jgi:predicted ATPase/transcriptional regulator with XRE-family HTH domain